MKLFFRNTLLLSFCLSLTAGANDYDITLPAQNPQYFKAVHKKLSTFFSEQKLAPPKIVFEHMTECLAHVRSWAISSESQFSTFFYEVAAIKGKLELASIFFICDDDYTRGFYYELNPLKKFVVKIEKDNLSVTSKDRVFSKWTWIEKPNLAALNLPPSQVGKIARVFRITKDGDNVANRYFVRAFSITTLTANSTHAKFFDDLRNNFGFTPHQFSYVNNENFRIYLP